MEWLNFLHFRARKKQWNGRQTIHQASSCKVSKTDGTRRELQATIKKSSANVDEQNTAKRPSSVANKKCCCSISRSTNYRSARVTKTYVFRSFGDKVRIGRSTSGFACSSSSLNQNSQSWRRAELKAHNLLDLRGQARNLPEKNNNQELSSLRNKISTDL